MLPFQHVTIIKTVSEIFSIPSMVTSCVHFTPGAGPGWGELSTVMGSGVL